jgi:hypothetical protein
VGFVPAFFSKHISKLAVPALGKKKNLQKLPANGKRKTEPITRRFLQKIANKMFVFYHSENGTIV